MQMAWTELRSIAKAEGPEAMWMFDFLDMTGDLQNGNGTLRIAIEFNKKVIWSRNVPITQSDIDPGGKTDDELKSTLSIHMRKQLSLVSQMHHARLDKLFPNTIKEVQLGYDKDKQEKTITVIFKNGHIAEASEAESKTDLFTARCAMLYDLPTR